MTHLRHLRNHAEVERARLLRGVLSHALVTAVVLTSAFLLNWTTRGPEGSWWVIWLVEAWAIAWALHIYGVAVKYPRDE